MEDEVPQDGAQDSTATSVGSEVEQVEHGHHQHDHEHEDGELSTECIGGGCITKQPTPTS
ncbi:hypothetical protein AB0K14_21430 [Actinosynnema sp. NPDC050801]|uniref:hypothetical protein n=1 Tax=unclassified Actinosynnema TaxID=2637065 RepID=UPI0033E0D9B5